MQNFTLKFQAVAEKTAKNFRWLLYFSAPCRTVWPCTNWPNEFLLLIGWWRH